MVGIDRQLDRFVIADDIKLHQKIAKIDVGGRLVDDDAHRAFGRVRAHIDDAAREPFVAHRRHRDQHLAVEIAALGSPASLGAGFHELESTPFPDSWESKLVLHPLCSDHGEFSGLPHRLPLDRA